MTHARFGEVKRKVRKQHEHQADVAVRDWYEANPLKQGNIAQLARVADAALQAWPSKGRHDDFGYSITTDAHFDVSIRRSAIISRLFENRP